MQQLWTVLGPDGSKYVIWLGVGLALVLGVALVIWLLMKIFGRSLNVGSGNSRGQQQRLGITGAFNVDRKGRKLVIVRRDNVEHLILIGGPNDVLVESSIIRAERGARPAAAASDVEMPTIPAPQPVPAPQAAPQLAPKPAAPQPTPAAPALPPQPRRDTPQVTAPTPVVVVAPPVARPAPVVPPVVMEPPRAPAPPVEIKAAEPLEIKSATPEMPAAPAEALPPRPATDPRLSDMARRLQSVLQRPMTPASRPVQADPAAAAHAETKPLPLPSARKPEAPAEPEAPVAIKPPKAPKAPVPEAKTPVTQGKDLPLSPIAADPLAIDSLEEEMARLLGRPGPGKP